VTGILRGFDSMVNLVLDECVEFVRDPEDPSKRKTITVQGKTVDVTRKLGIVVCRGTAVSYICPAEGTQEISNPFVEQEGDE
jgi:U6 snRNA-associated Sm-like protein LSm7